jgi:serine/threonine-protein kinase HipA
MHKDILHSDLMTLAEANSLKKGEKIIEEIRTVVCRWEEYAERVKVPEGLRDGIAGTLVGMRF